MCMKKDTSKVKCWKLWNVISLHWICTPENIFHAHKFNELNIILKFQDHPANWVCCSISSHILHSPVPGEPESFTLCMPDWIILKSTHEILDRYPVSTIHLCDWSVMIMCICPCNIQMWQCNFMNVIFIHTTFLYCSLFNALRSFWKLQLLQILYHHGYQHVI